MKKALFISSRPLFPLVGGERIRTAQSLRFLSKLCTVDVICMSNQREYDLGNLKSCIHSYYHFYVPNKLHYFWTLRFLVNSDPLQVNYYYSTKIQKFIDHIIDDYDMVYCNNIRTAKYFMHHSNVVRCIDFVDSIAMNYVRAKKASKGLKKMIFAIDAKRCYSYEQKLLKLFERKAVISNVDRDFMLLGNKDAEVFLVDNAVTIPKVDFKKRKLSSALTFVGKMSYEPNVVAVTTFVHKVLPFILKKNPNVVFYIVGAEPTKEVESLQSSHVIVTGFVEDVAEYMSQSSIVVAPMLTGAGIQNKILQAMALKNCVVTTTIGAEGLYIEDNEIAIVDDYEKMAETILSLLSDKERRKDMGAKAFTYIVNHLSEEKVFEAFQRFVCL